jgi:sulfate adenylyltransferase large subunit
MTAAAPETASIETFLKQNEEKELLRLSTAGSVDDGKSTLIGRLLYDAKGVYEDQLASVRRVTANETAGAFDLALLTDGLRAEREQGITIDVAYRYFSTPRRKFIIADTPGHEQYTRNMATGASTADLAVILVDARNGVLPQSRRHAFIAALLGIPHLVVAVNKMDLVGFREEVFLQIRAEFGRFAGQLALPDIHYIPISALLGDNVVEGSVQMPWYTGPSLLEHLETVPIASGRNFQDFRFPVQYVIRPHQDFRGFAGQVVSGMVRPGDEVVVLPSGRTSRVASIVTYDGNLPQAFPPMSVTLTLEDEIDVSRGDMIAHASNPPQTGPTFQAHVVWMTDKKLTRGAAYVLKHTTQTVKATVEQIRSRVNVLTAAGEPAHRLGLNEIGVVEFRAGRPLFFDPYSANRSTGAFILIDPLTNETAGAGMIFAAKAAPESVRAAAPGRPVTAAERRARLAHPPGLAVLPDRAGLIAAAERLLFDHGYVVVVLHRPTASAVRDCYAAGLMVIAAGCAADDLEAVRLDVDPARLLVYGESWDGGIDALAEDLRARGMLGEGGSFVGGEI